MQEFEYFDDYATCEETHATFRVYPGEMDPDEVTRILKITPTKIQRKSELKKKGNINGINAWFLSTKEKIASRDSRRHIDSILDHLKGRKEGIDNIRKRGGRCDISCYWVSLTGHGGPTLSPQQTRPLADLDIEIWFDVYLGGDE